MANEQNLKPFKKGEDSRRHKTGRPKKIPQLDVLLAEILGDEQNGITAAQAILSALRSKATKGDVKAAEILLDRAYGKAKQSVDHTTNGKAIENSIDVKIHYPNEIE